MMKTGTCKHFTGLSNDACAACVRYDSVRGMDGQSFFPCIKVYGAGGPREHKNDRWADTCDKYEEPSDKEVADFEAMVEAESNRMMATLSAINPWRKKHQGHDFQAVIECPICKGRLHLSIAGSYNNHVHGHCETKDCVSWME